MLKIVKATYKGKDLFYVQRKVCGEWFYLNKHGEIALNPRNRIGYRKFTEANNVKTNYEKYEEAFIRKKIL